MSYVWSLGLGGVWITKPLPSDRYGVSTYPYAEHYFYVGTTESRVDTPMHTYMSKLA